MTTRVAEGGGGEYGACHYTLAGGVRVPRNLYFSPFPFSFLDPPPTLSSRLSLPFFAARRLRLVARSLRVFGKCPLRPRALLLFPSLAAFSQAYNSRSTCPRRILRISLSCSSSQAPPRGDRFQNFPRASRDYSGAPPRPRRAGMIIRNRFARLRDPCIHNVYAAQSGYSRSPIRVANESLRSDKRVSRVIATSLQ